MRDGTALLRASSAIVLRNLLKACRFSAISFVFSIKKHIFAADIMNYNKGDLIMMLGINAPKPAVKGEFAKAVRKAVRDSMVAKENWKEPATKGPWKVKFVVR